MSREQQATAGNSRQQQAIATVSNIRSGKKHAAHKRTSSSVDPAVEPAPLKPPKPRDRPDTLPSKVDSAKEPVENADCGRHVPGDTGRPNSPDKAKVLARGGGMCTHTHTHTNVQPQPKGYVRGERLVAAGKPSADPRPPAPSQLMHTHTDMQPEAVHCLSPQLLSVALPHPRAHLEAVTGRLSPKKPLPLVRIGVDSTPEALPAMLPRALKLNVSGDAPSSRLPRRKDPAVEPRPALPVVGPDPSPGPSP